MRSYRTDHGPVHAWNDGVVQYGSKKDGSLHRVTGPAVVDSNGFIAFRLDGAMTRVDGPCAYYPEGNCSFSLGEKLLTYEEFLTQVSRHI